MPQSNPAVDSLGADKIMAELLTQFTTFSVEQKHIIKKIESLETIRISDAKKIELLRGEVGLLKEQVNSLREHSEIKTELKREMRKSVITWITAITAIFTIAGILSSTFFYDKGLHNPVPGYSQKK